MRNLIWPEHVRSSTPKENKSYRIFSAQFLLRKSLSEESKTFYCCNVFLYPNWFNRLMVTNLVSGITCSRKGYIINNTLRGGQIPEINAMNFRGNSMTALRTWTVDDYSSSLRLSRACTISSYLCRMEKPKPLHKMTYFHSCCRIGRYFH